jgi:hypothetical protein
MSLGRSVRVLAFLRIKRSLGSLPGESWPIPADSAPELERWRDAIGIIAGADIRLPLIHFLCWAKSEVQQMQRVVLLWT